MVNYTGKIEQLIDISVVDFPMASFGFPDTNDSLVFSE